MLTSGMIWTACQLLLIALFVGGSAGVAATFTWETLLPQHGPIVTAFFVAIMLGMEGLKPIAVHAAWNGLIRLQWVAIPALIGAAACVFASFLTELQVLARAHSQYVATATDATGKGAEWSRKRAEVRADLDALGATRTAAEIKPLIDAASVAAGDCARIGTVTQRRACEALPGLQSEEARAARAASLRATLEGIDKAAGPARGQSAESASLAGLLAVAGFRVQPGTLDDMLALLRTVLLQTGSALCMVLAPLAQGGPQSGSKPRQQGGARGDNLVTTGLSEDHERFLVVLRGSNGSLKGGQRQLAAAFGMGQDRKRFLRVADYLASLGRITVTKERDGTTVALVEK